MDNAVAGYIRINDDIYLYAVVEGVVSVFAWANTVDCESGQERHEYRLKKHIHGSSEMMNCNKCDWLTLSFSASINLNVSFVV